MSKAIRWIRKNPVLETGARSAKRHNLNRGPQVSPLNWVFRFYERNAMAMVSVVRFEDLVGDAHLQWAADLRWRAVDVYDHITREIVGPETPKFALGTEPYELA